MTFTGYWLNVLIIIYTDGETPPSLHTEGYPSLNSSKHGFLYLSNSEFQISK